MHRIHVGNLRAAATRAGDTSDYQIGKRTGLGKATVSRLVNRHAAPSVDTLVCLARSYGMRLEDLLQEVPAT